jgi:hypothetical protein
VRQLCFCYVMVFSPLLKVIGALVWFELELAYLVGYIVVLFVLCHGIECRPTVVDYLD